MPTNYALASNGGTVLTDDTEFSGYPKSNIIDGNTATGWFPATIGVPRSVRNILSTARSISGVKFWFMSGYKPSAWSVYYWNSTTSAYVLIANLTDSSGASLNHTFSAVDTNEIKTTTTTGGAGWAAWMEIEVNGDPISDTTPPADMTLSSATVISNSQINVAFSTPSDNIGVTAIKVQRSTANDFSANLVEYDNQSASSPFNNNAGLNPSVNTTYYYRAKAKDAAGNYSTNWSNTVSATITVQVAITTASPVANTIGQAASGSFAASGGSGSGTWSKVSGNYPTGISVNSAGAISGSFSAIGTFNFRMRFVDAVGGGANNVEKDFVWTVGQVALESTYSPTSGLSAPEQLTFTEATAVGTVTDQKISFGDHSIQFQADDADFTHTYLAPGTYKFERWAKIDGVPAYETYVIVIGGTPPTPTGTAIEFDEIELNRGYSEGATGGPEYSTNVLGNPLGVQQRNANRPIGLHSFEINFEGLNQFGEEFEDFLDFFHTRQGAAIGFRFFPNVDNRWVDEEIAKTNTSTATYKLIRTYSKGGRTRVRRIVKPVPDLIVTINDNPATDYSAYTVDYTTGKITFTTPASLPSNGSLKVTGNYCIPVVFATDLLNITGFNSYADLAGLRVVELPPAALGITD